MKFLKNLFEYIKNFLKKHKTETEKNNLEQLSNQTQMVEDYDALYNQIKVGDIIWAKRYQNEIEKESIPEGHREGPFIVLKKENGKLISIKGTSVVPNEEYIDMDFYLNNDGYNLDKETYFKLNKLYFINEYSFISHMDKLKEKDKNKLFLHIKSSKKVYYVGKWETIDFNFPIQVGDIVNYDHQSFIVLDNNDKNIICVPLKNHLDYKNNTNLEVTNFINIDFSKSISLEINSDIKYVNTVNNKCLQNILTLFQKYINNCKNMQTTQRGSIIFKDNKYYYIYGEEGQDWLVFEINKKGSQNASQLEIGNTKYHTNFEESKISKKDSFTNIYLCLDEEKDKIKNIRKKYKDLKKKIETNGVLNYVRFGVGDIIQSINYKNKRYIIIKICKKTYECLCIEEIINGIYDPVLLMKTDVKLAIDNSIKGIKWLDENPEFELKYIGNFETINNIFRTQKKFLKSNQNNTNVLNNQINNISEGTLIKRDENSYETFKVLQVVGEMIVCQGCNELGIKHYFNKNNVIIVESKQKRK